MIVAFASATALCHAESFDPDSDGIWIVRAGKSSGGGPTTRFAGATNPPATYQGETTPTRTQASATAKNPFLNRRRFKLVTKRFTPSHSHATSLAAEHTAPQRFVLRSQFRNHCISRIDFTHSISSAIARTRFNVPNVRPVPCLPTPSARSSLPPNFVLWNPSGA